MRLITALILLLPAAPSIAADELPDPLFQGDAVLEATLSGPLHRLVRERPKEEYLQGSFEYRDEAGQMHTLSAQIRTRGNYRHANCDFPPIRLNFRKSETRDTLFDKQDKLKLVVHCDSAARHEQSVLREYLAYRVFNMLTDHSFKVRLLRVSYRDDDERLRDHTRFAFLIEHDDRLAKRMGKEALEISSAEVSEIHPDVLNLSSLFQFFIGNTDFSPVAGAAGRDCCHNHALFGDEEGLITAIPYDFDMSGFVDAPYATPNPRFGLRSVRQRLYRGRCVNNEHLAGSIDRFQGIREAVFALVQGQEGLSESNQKRVSRYVETFYDLIGDPRRVQRSIIDKCI